MQNLKVDHCGDDHDAEIDAGNGEGADCPEGEQHVRVPIVRWRRQALLVQHDGRKCGEERAHLGQE